MPRWRGWSSATCRAGRSRRLPADSRAVPRNRPTRDELQRVRRSGFAVNQERSEQDVVAVGVPLRALDGRVLAWLSVSMPSAKIPVRAWGSRREVRAVEGNGRPPRFG
ncbi:IclR family transcriptional regulator C-terminal domain-containing protein [Parafrankia sp. EUN1f]|uniref:IclR family transcriptional regulator domain-containing protein n=1 Tax=Parafrankia sp. EUN1f TaxID=102897 RepID=UPI00350FDED5